jgi:hypothetical protein
MKASGQQPGHLSLFCQERNGLLFEGHEGFATKPVAFIGHDTVSEIVASFQNRKPCLDSGTVHDDISSIEQIADRDRHIFLWEQGREIAINEASFIARIIHEGIE